MIMSENHKKKVANQIKEHLQSIGYTDKVMYVIAESGRPNRTKYNFVSTLKHEFKCMKEVLGYSDLDHALMWDDEATAEKHLAELPDWAKNKHKVYKVTWSTFWFDYYQELMRAYRDFVLRICNDGCSCDILWKDSWRLIGIVGSMEKAVAWVDEWYNSQSSKNANDCK